MLKLRAFVGAELKLSHRGCGQNLGLPGFMYSYEDRIRAVELYIKLGKRVQATIGQLGYPTENALKAWCREYEK